MPAERITLLGTGAMATVCSQLLVANGHAVRLWGHSQSTVDALLANREQTRLLPGARIPDTAELTADPAAALINATLIVSCIPAQYTREAWQRLAPAAPPGIPIVSVTKGIENGSLLRPTEVIRQVLGETTGRGVAVLSGPNIAAELARGQPATAVVASADPDLARRVQTAFSAPAFRVYTNPDPLGVELAGATKNVIAIAAGILDGMRAGNNAKAALVTRGLVEITRLGVAMGARTDTFMGLAGLGDLLTTCVSPEGRNRSLGQRIGEGLTLDQALAGMSSVVEGVATSRSVLELARRHGVDMPITEMLHAILFEGVRAHDGLNRLMTREPKPESRPG